MDKLKFYTDFYGVLQTPKGFHQNVLTPLRRMVRGLANKRLPEYFRKVKSNEPVKIEEDIIVSLTSFPARIEYVYLTIESLLRQTHRPYKILLWLSLDQFADKSSLPDSLLNLENDIFEIRMVEGDIRSHKKYYYALQEFPQRIMITVDDDIIYSPLLVESMMRNHNNYPNAIIANKTSRMTFDADKPALYESWNHEVVDFACDNLVQIGCGGVLYPKDCLYGDVTDKNLFMQLCPQADDLWLNAMARMTKTPIVQSDFRLLCLPILIFNNQSLYTSNCGQNLNDGQLTAIDKYYRNKGAQLYSKD